jgi:hypothetical protein
MEHLCGTFSLAVVLCHCSQLHADEILQLIFFQLNDPGPFTLISKRFYQFSQDPYIRAHYFLTRYGEIQAMFWALGRGKIITDRVLDVRLPIRLCCTRLFLP